MPNSRGQFVIRSKYNIKELDPIAVGVYGKDFFDVSKKADKEIEDFVKRAEFDFPLWFKHNKGFSFKRIGDYNPPIIFQVGGCNFHDGTETGGCWYCFVDDTSNDGLPSSGKTYMGIGETVDSAVNARKKIASIYRKVDKDIDPKVIRISGGEPTIALDWILDLWREIEKQNQDFVGQIDSNLSTGKVVDSFEEQGIYEQDILKKLARYPIKVLTAIKGTDEKNIQENVQSTATMEDQIYSIRKFLEAGFDIYPQMYNPNPETLEAYLKRMDNEEIENFSQRVHIGPLKIYGPTKKRLTFEATRIGAEPEVYIQQKKSEWDENYAKSAGIINQYLIDTYGIGYKDVTRSDVKLKLI